MEKSSCQTIIKYMNSKYFSPKANQQFFESFLRTPREVKLYRIRFDSIFNEYLHRKSEY